MSVEDIRIGDVVAEGGTKRRGFLKVGETAVGPIQIPVVIVRGTRPGPTLCLTAGVHGTEYPGISAVMQTAQKLDPREMAGTVIAVPVVNVPMYQARTPFISPIDGLNLNRVFPGKPDGSISEMIAHALYTEVIRKATHHIDCHGGDLTEVLWPYAGYNITGNAELDRMGEAMARLYSPQIFALYREGSLLPPTRGSVSSESASMGLASILAESGSAGSLDPEHVRVHLNGITNVMRFLGIIPGEPLVAGDKRVATGQFIVQAHRGGLVRLNVKIGDVLKEGQEIGDVVDVFGDVVERLQSPAEGVVRIIWTHKVVNSGDAILKCWTTEAAPPFPLTDRFIQ